MLGRSSNKVKLGVMIAGLALLGLTLSADWIGIGGTPGFGKRQIAMLVAALFGIGIGGGWVAVDFVKARSISPSRALLDSRPARAIVKGAGMVALGIGSVVVVEVILMAGFFVSDAFFAKGEGDERKLGASAYDFVDYDDDQIKREFSESTADLAYQPYTVWSRRPYQGELINVDEAGDRVTHNNATREDALEVWIFGGSTTWGTGAPDDQTIASHLARLLNEWGVDGAVRNYGETAYVSTQELFYLQRKLQSGRVPSVVLFYDGANDAHTPYETPDEPGAHTRIAAIRAKVEKPDRGVFSLEVDLSAILSATAFSRAALAIVGEGNSPGAEDVSELVSEYMVSGVNASDEIKSYAETALSIMAANYKSVRGIGKEYGFLPFFFLQPGPLAGTKPLTPAEQKFLEDTLSKTPQAGWTILVHSQMAKVLREAAQEDERLDQVYDLTDAFDGVTDPVFVDWIHITGPGNEVVARRILEIVQKEICREVPGNASAHTREQLATACADGS